MQHESGQLKSCVHRHGTRSGQLGYRNQVVQTKEGRREMTLLQNASLRKTLGEVKRSSRRKVSAIATVENVETLAKATTGRLLTRTLCDPTRAGIGQVDKALRAEGEVSFRGR